jgi:hypothetical protein
MIGASIIVKELKGIGAICNAYGYYSLTLPKGNYTLEISYTGYKKVSQNIGLSSNFSLGLVPRSSASYRKLTSK